MLDDVTKKRINTLRQILVGKLPDPKAQVEQITNGLIYKFMNDMDEQSVSLGGKASYFSGKFEKFSWKNLMNSKTSGSDRLELYKDAIEKMYNNENLPELFREIFKNSFLPFKDPSTLNMFLKEINEFNYSNSEKLGDAFEYLLSFMGSQGDAGQFRTPRHIIDFIVEIVNPQKNETVLDPACGTSGFLISSYKHILSQNTKKNLGDGLTASDRKIIGENLNGYDISPDMVKMSLVNMYLHKFTNPKINEYDTLSSEERWNEYYDVIVANPPFFSPKGGITPHNRFGVKSSKAEVLFVDYINAHLNPNGRAGIIVPDGIIFDPKTIFKTLRKNLINESLIGVISLPKGIFLPYSGVKTSILILDKKLSKNLDHIFFDEMKNDGFALSNNRKPINDNDIPEIKNRILKFFKNGKNIDENLVSKKTILSSNDITLKKSRYFSKIKNLSKYKLEKLEDVIEYIDDGDWIETKDQSDEGIRLIQTGNIGEGEFLEKATKSRYINEETFERLKCRELKNGEILLSRLPDPVARCCKLPNLDYKCITSVDVSIIKFNNELILDDYFIFLTYSKYYYDEIERYTTGSSRDRISKKNLLNIEIPLPSIEEQKKILNKINQNNSKINENKKINENLFNKIIEDVDQLWISKK
tara:strand:+ start:699 stop:2627 length:1929 start_codon:yes stop_codon:yes gene_type:complete